MKKFIVNKINKSMAPATVIEPVLVKADYFEVNSNGDLILYKHNEDGLPLPYQPVVAFASGNWLTVDDQSLSEDKNEVS